MGTLFPVEFNLGVCKRMNPMKQKKWCEIWKPISGFEGLYEVSSFGRVKSLERQIKDAHGGTCIRKGIPLNPRQTGRGYLSVAIHKNGERFTFGISRLVGKAFIPNPHNMPEINHIDGIKSNNRHFNLEWSNRSLNMLHAWKNGLQKKTPNMGRPRLCGTKRPKGK